MPRTSLSGTTSAGNKDLIGTGVVMNWFEFQNVSDTDMWLRIGGTPSAASQPSYLIVAGSMYRSPEKSLVEGPISVFCAVASKGYTAYYG